MSDQKIIDICQGRLMSSLSYAYGGAGVYAEIRSSPEDFRVDEELPFEPDDEGDHALIRLQKRGCNTEWVARQLIRHAGVRNQDVGYAGLKDRNALTTQWFSVDLSGRAEPDWGALETDELKILEVHRHRRKLRRGVLRGNQFKLILRNLEGDVEALGDKLRKIRDVGVPNYFGEQRFGRIIDGAYGNLQQADQLFSGALKRKPNRHKKGLYYSSARSWIFNCVLSERIHQHCWDEAISGDVMMLDGSASIFLLDKVDEEVRQRVLALDVHPTGPLCGEGPLGKGKCAELEESIFDQYKTWVDGLNAARIKAARRSLRLLISNLEWEFTNDRDLVLQFFLVKGSYATSVLRELVTSN